MWRGHAWHVLRSCLCYVHMARTSARLSARRLSFSCSPRRRSAHQPFQPHELHPRLLAPRTGRVQTWRGSLLQGPDHLSVRRTRPPRMVLEGCSGAVFGFPRPLGSGTNASAHNPRPQLSEARMIKRSPAAPARRRAPGFSCPAAEKNCVRGGPTVVSQPPLASVLPDSSVRRAMAMGWR